MVEALLAGFLADGVTTPAGLWVTDVASDRLAALRQRYGVRTGNDNAAAAAWAGVIVLAVKPPAMDAVVGGLKGRLLGPAPISSLAGGGFPSRGSPPPAGAGQVGGGWFRTT